MGKRVLLLAICILFAAAATATATAIAANPQPVAIEGLPRDGRLDVPVRLRHGRVYLGDLTAELSRVSHAEISVSNDKGPLDGIDLTAYTYNRPVREVMTGLAELLSTGANRWMWRMASSKDGSRSYVLSCERPPMEAGASIRE